MRRGQRTMLRAVAGIMALLLMCLLAGCAETADEAPAEGTVIEEEETLPPVEVAMPEYELTYAGELKDLIVVKEVKDAAGLDFFVKLSEQEAAIFTLRYNTDEGELVTVLTDGQDNRIPVAFEMAETPEGLSEEDEAQFYLAQEAVNEIVESLKLK